MSYRTILSFLPSSTKAPAIAQCAAVMAQAFQARLVGLSINLDFAVPLAPGAVMPPEYLEKPDAFHRAERDAIKATLSHVSRARDVESEFRVAVDVRTMVADVITQHALSSDLIVMPQATGGEWGPWAELPDRVIINCGRPVFVVPDKLLVEDVPKRIVVAWTDGPQSARSLFDAIPLCSQAEVVQVVGINGTSSGSFSGSLAIDEVTLSLARHGVNVEAVTDRREHMNVGHAILEHAREFHADALVMGCFGHSRFRESILGGASWTVLNEATLPVLTSH
ncbi:MAG: universal stress protein [Pseudomonadota bacterium]